MRMEQSIASARATVLVYDDQNKRWVPAGPSQTQGVSKVHIYQNTTASTYRVVGRKLQDHEVVLNCPILKNLRYNQATATFHQWRDQKLVYGLNFISKEDADAFATAMQRAVEVLVAAHKAKQAQAAAVQQDQASGGYQTIAEQHARKSVSPHAQPNNVGGSSAVTCANAAALSSESAYSPQATQRNVNPSQQHAASALYSTPLCDPNAANSTSLYNPELQTNSCEMEPTAHTYGVLPATNAGPVGNHGVVQSAYADPQSHALPNGAAQQLRNGTTQVQAQPPAAPPPPAPPVAARPQVVSSNAQSTLQSGGGQAEKESSPPEQADSLAVALRSVRLKKAADPGAARDAVCNDQAANNKANANDSAKQSAALANDASRNNGGSARTSLPANSNEVLSEMQRVFAARKARIDATSNEPVNGATLMSAPECNQQTTAVTATSTSPKLAARNSNLNANALDAPVTLRELQELKAELVGEIRREIGALKSELVETLRQQVFTNHR